MAVGKQGNQTDNSKIQLIVTNQELNDVVKKITNNYCVKYALPMIDSVVLEVRRDLTEKLFSCEYDRKGNKKLEKDRIIQAQMNRAAQIVQLEAARQQQLFGEGVGVAVLDTGVYPHSDLVYGGNRIIAFCDVVNGRRYAYDDNGHGTHACSWYSQLAALALLIEKWHGIRKDYTIFTNKWLLQIFCCDTI